MKRPMILVILFCFLVSLWSGCVMAPMGQLNQYTYSRVEYHLGMPSRVIPIWIDEDFSLSDRHEINMAISQWNYVLNGYVKLEVVDSQYRGESWKLALRESNQGWVFLRITSDNSIVPRLKDKHWMTLGFVERIGGSHLYLVRDRLLDGDIFGVTLHEIGHLLGSGHVGKRLMYPHYTQVGFQCVDYDTLIEVSKYLNLPLSRLNYCIENGQLFQDYEYNIDCGVGRIE